MAADAGVRKTVTLLGVIVAAIVVLTLVRPFWLAEDEPGPNRPPQLQHLGVVVFPEPQPIERFTLVDQSGTEVSREDLKGQWTIAFLGYSRCRRAECENLPGILTEFDASTAKGPSFWFITADPERDDPAALEQYLQPMEIEIRGLTGQREQLLTLARSLKGTFNPAAANDQPEAAPAIEFSGHLGLISPGATLVAIAQRPVNSQKLADAYRRITAWYED